MQLSNLGFLNSLINGHAIDVHKFLFSSLQVKSECSNGIKRW
ncbi:hypothetical protein SOVF_200730 isoform B [Spinacia oleracea]|nr:hypothetical protein SOVF_200730 isoform B [Spinacia oleracea]